MRSIISIIGIATIVAFAPATAGAQIALEIHGSAGYSQVDVDEWAGTAALDWDQFTSGIHVQAWYRSPGGSRLSVGAEWGYQYLLFYQIRYSGYRLDRDVDATRVMGLVRIPFGDSPVFADVGAGAYLFDSFTDLAVMAAAGTSFGLSQKLRVPVKFRADVLFDEDAMMIPFGLTIGLTYDLSR